MEKITLGSGKAECLDPKEGVGLACSRARVAGARGVLVTPVLPLVKTASALEETFANGHL